MNIRSLIPFGFGSMTARGTDPFTDLRREMDRLFDDFTKDRALPASSGAGFPTPKVNVAESDAGLEATFDEGVPKVVVPRAPESAKPVEKIEVKGG